MTKPSSAGFTIIELLIATTVLSSLLLIVTLAMTNIGNLFYKGISSSRVQSDTRDIVNLVARDLQLSSGAQPTVTAPFGSYTVYATCIGSVRYSYIIGVQIGSGSTQVAHVLWRDTNPTPTNCVPLDITQAQPPGSNNGSELISPHSRLADFEVNQSVNSPGLYTLQVTVAYGEDALLCSPSVSSCSRSYTLLRTDYPLPDIACKGQTGDQFCSTSSITTSVVQRLAGS